MLPFRRTAALEEEEADRSWSCGGSCTFDFASDGLSGHLAPLPPRSPSSGRDMRQCRRRLISYPVQLPLGDASDSAVEVQVLLAGEQVVQRVHLGTVADVDALLAALHNVHQTPGERDGWKTRRELLNGRPPGRPRVVRPTKHDFGVQLQRLPGRRSL